MPVLALKGSAMALAALVFMFSLIPFGGSLQAEIYGYQDGTFWGVLWDNRAEVPVVLQVEAPEKEPEEKEPGEPPDPGKVRVFFEKKGEDFRLEYDRDIGAGEISPDEQERIDKVIDASIKFSEKTIEGKSVPRKILNFLKNIKTRPEPIFFKKV